MNVYEDDAMREAITKGGHNSPLDLLSEEFADLALAQMETTHRTPYPFTANGQEFTAMILGFGSSFSESEEHNGHMPGTPPTPGERCPVCRWADVAILKTVPTEGAEPMYLLATMGKSEVAGESNRIKTVWTTDPMGVLRNLSVAGRDGASAKIPIPNARAFRYAAHTDAGIREVLQAHDEAIPDVQRRRADLPF